MFIAALFIVVKTWKKPKCPLVGEWVNKFCIQTMENFPHSKEISYQAMKTPGGTLGEYTESKKKSEKAICHMIPIL